jgi:RNA polymerase sigma factor (sigma-70 family)
MFKAKFRHRGDFQEALNSLVNNRTLNLDQRRDAIEELNDTFVASFGEAIPTKFISALARYFLEEDYINHLGRINMEYPYHSMNQVRKRGEKEIGVYDRPDSTGEDYLSYHNNKKVPKAEDDIIASLDMERLISDTDLTPAELEVVYMVYFQGLSQADAARHLDISRMAVTYRLQRGLQKLQEKADELGVELG